MTVVVQFYENTEEDTEYFKKVFKENRSQMVILYTKISEKLQIKFLFHDIIANSSNKNIMLIKYPKTEEEITNNKIINNIINGIPIEYLNHSWLPKEIWILYNFNDSVDDDASYIYQEKCNN